MYTVYKIVDYPYMKKVCSYATCAEATAEAEWAEEHGAGRFVVLREETPGVPFSNLAPF